MATQKYCNNALIALRDRIQNSAREAGHTTVRGFSNATQVQYLNDEGDICTHSVSRSAISKIYNLEHYPTLDTLLALSRVCDTTVAYWTTGLAQEVETPEPAPAPEPTPEPTPEPAQPDTPEPTPEAQPDRKPKIDLLAMLKGMNPNQ